jgi:hypothetical protein
MDLILMSKSARSADHIKTRQNNLSSSTFFDILEPEFFPPEKVLEIIPTRAAWNKRMELTTHYQEVDGTHKDYAMYVDITDSAIISNTETDGRDILFTDATGTLIPFYIEEFDQAAGRIKAHLKVDISNNYDTITYLFFGNSAAVDAQNSPGVFSSDTKAAFLFDETSRVDEGVALKDYSASPITGTMIGATTSQAGDIGKSQLFSTSIGRGVYNAITPKLTLTNKFTVISVIKKAAGFNNPVWFNMGDNVNLGITLLYFGGAAIPRLNLNTIGTGTLGHNNLTPTIGDGNFHSVVFSYDGANVRGYTDGVLISTGAQTGNIALTQDDTLQIGGANNQDSLSWGNTGSIDDLRVYNTVKSDDFIKTIHNNYFNPEVFTTQSGVKDNNG